MLYTVQRTRHALADTKLAVHYRLEAGPHA
jgi:hypothetical protein